MKNIVIAIVMIKSKKNLGLVSISHTFSRGNTLSTGRQILKIHTLAHISSQVLKENGSKPCNNKTCNKKKHKHTQIKDFQ